MKSKSASGRGGLRLAPGYRLRIGRRAGRSVLVTPAGPVPLNEAAAAVLALCDGTCSRDDIVARVAGSDNPTVAGDVRAFIAVARRSGWILER
jgi:coenzyme PQQ biosynthesis protein PqqD